MSTTTDQPISAVKKVNSKEEKREFSPTQWAAMGKDKAGWKAAKPAEALLTDTGDKGKGADVALLNARERYAALFDKQPAPNIKLETLEAKIADELKRQNEGGDGSQKKSSAPAAPAANVPTTPVNPEGNTGDANTGKAAADANKGTDSQTEQQ